MAKYRVDVSESAENDLRDIIRYISSQLFAPTTALQFMNIMENALANLSDMPASRPPITDERLASLGYRKLVVKNYIAFFTIDEKNKVVNIERILYTRRDWLRIL